MATRRSSPFFPAAGKTRMAAATAGFRAQFLGGGGREEQGGDDGGRGWARGWPERRRRASAEVRVWARALKERERSGAKEDRDEGREGEEAQDVSSSRRASSRRWPRRPLSAGHAGACLAEVEEGNFPKTPWVLGISLEKLKQPIFNSILAFGNFVEIQNSSTILGKIFCGLPNHN
jgi:hypothetical protein